MNFASKKNEILQILAKDMPLQTKIDSIREVRYSAVEIKCFACKAKQNAAAKLLEQEKNYEISKLQQEINNGK
jgi:hypothetical protein